MLYSSYTSSFSAFWNRPILNRQLHGAILTIDLSFNFSSCLTRKTHASGTCSRRPSIEFMENFWTSVLTSGNRLTTSSIDLFTRQSDTMASPNCSKFSVRSLMDSPCRLKRNIRYSLNGVCVRLILTVCLYSRCFCCGYCFHFTRSSRYPSITLSWLIVSSSSWRKIRPSRSRSSPDS